MSFNRIEISNFQSLRRVELDLGAFTVIVGPSSSGKSALIRAFRALASNVRGSGVITRGQKQMAITGYTDTHTITLERSDRSGAYKLCDAAGTNLTFTKLAGEVPELVTKALRIDPVTDRGSINFASQFDKPYLLDESGATIARELAELTNVTRVFEAVRAGNRIRANAASTLKTRKADLEDIKGSLAAFSGLSERLALLDQVEKLAGRRKELESQAGRLDTALRTVRIAQRAIDKATLPQVPDGGPLDAALTRFLDLDGRLRGLAAKQARFERARSDAFALTAAAVTVERELQLTLEQAGICPTCGQEIHG